MMFLMSTYFRMLLVKIRADCFDTTKIGCSDIIKTASSYTESEHVFLQVRDIYNMYLFFRFISSTVAFQLCFRICHQEGSGKQTGLEIKWYT
jgi:hypothetical protein